MSSNSGASLLAPKLRQQLLELAGKSIRQGLSGERLPVRAVDYAKPLRVQRATFVTLNVERTLRGCIGTLEAKRTLVEDVAQNAYSAAFQDPRFPALTWTEFERLHVHISILSPPEPMQFSSEEDLLAQLRPDVDGLIIEEGFYRGTFLPSVWGQLREPRDFLRHLKQKAGMPPDHWSEHITIRRYTTESVS